MSDTKKWLYKFDVEETIDGNKKVRTFGFLKPSRKLREDGDIFFSAQTSKFVKAGILPKAAWSTVLSDGGGSISEKERELYGSLLIEFRDKSFELQKLLIKFNDKKSKEDENKISELTSELNDIKDRLQAFESSQIAIFENTAEAKARNKTILWWVCNISSERLEDGSVKPLLAGESLEDKLDYYDNLEDDQEKNKFILSILRRSSYLITLWFIGRIVTTEDFELYDKEFLKTNSYEEKQEDTKEKNNEQPEPLKEDSELFVPEKLNV